MDNAPLVASGDWSRHHGLYMSGTEHLYPTEKLPLSKWAEKNFKLSEYSSRTGALTLYEFQREPADAFTDPTVDTIVLMCGTQLLKTLLIQMATAFVIEADKEKVEKGQLTAWEQLAQVLLMSNEFAFVD